LTSFSSFSISIRLKGFTNVSPNNLTRDSRFSFFLRKMLKTFDENF
jgi:hypothetical protein